MQHLLVRSILVSNSSEGYQWVCILSVLIGGKTKKSGREHFTKGKRMPMLSGHGNKYTLMQSWLRWTNLCNILKSPRPFYCFRPLFQQFQHDFVLFILTGLASICLPLIIAKKSHDSTAIENILSDYMANQKGISCGEPRVHTYRKDVSRFFLDLQCAYAWTRTTSFRWTAFLVVFVWRCPQVAHPWVHDERRSVHSRRARCRTSCVVVGAWSVLCTRLWNDGECSSGVMSDADFFESLNSSSRSRSWV